jgi:hypothetical protein
LRSAFAVARLLPALLLAAPVTVLADHSPPPGDPDEATFASSRLRIPEPMVFDLVRPLGAPKGELEVNTLFLAGAGDGSMLDWAPEVEYTFADGWGLELELPMQNSRVEAYKLGLQGKLPGLSTARTLQGVQVIVEWERDVRSTRVDLLHLFGWQVSPDWSVVAMNGVRRYPSPRTDLGYLGNYSLFRRFSSRLELGLETNLETAAGEPGYLLTMPQVLWRAAGFNIQAGVGAETEDRATNLKAAWRISREF